jgi:hypothetical protein
VPNALSSPRFWRNQAVLLKVDSAYGTDPVPTGAANWMEARNVSYTPFDPEKVDRNIVQAYMGRSGTDIVSVWGKVSFDIAMAGSGAAGTAPKYGAAIGACGFADTNTPATSDVYNLVTTAFASSTVYMNIDGTLYKFVSCRGEMKGKIDAKGIPVHSFDLQSTYAAPAASAMFSPITKTGWPAEEPVNSAKTGKVTINSVDLAFSSFQWATGNKIERIDLPGPQLEVAITDRAPTASIIVLAPGLGTFDPYALANAGTNVALSNTHGSAAGKKAKHDLKVVIVNVAEVQVQGMLGYNLTLEPTPVSGNDEIAITFF